MLNSSKDKLPTSFVLVEKCSDEEKKSSVVAFAKLRMYDEASQSGMIESVSYLVFSFYCWF